MFSSDVVINFSIDWNTSTEYLGSCSCLDTYIRWLIKQPPQPNCLAFPLFILTQLLCSYVTPSQPCLPCCHENGPGALHCGSPKTPLWNTFMNRAWPGLVLSHHVTSRICRTLFPEWRRPILVAPLLRAGISHVLDLIKLFFSRPGSWHLKCGCPFQISIIQAISIRP